MANRLAHETSPYLLQHADNPVDWYPWGEEALRLARERGQADPALDRLLRLPLVPRHGARELRGPRHRRADERALRQHQGRSRGAAGPRSLYMNAVQVMTGHGGWPMTVFLTPEGKPFYGGTYFPPPTAARWPASRRILRGVAEAYRDRASRHRRQRRAASPSTARRTSAPVPASDGAGRRRAGRSRPRAGRPVRPGQRRLRRRAEVPSADGAGIPAAAARAHWARHGALEMAELTLDKMARGGIYDQLGGGFHRYAVDASGWCRTSRRCSTTTPNSPTSTPLAWQLTGKPFYRPIAEETLDYVAARDDRSPDGGFYSTQDADSEGARGQVLRLDAGRA